MTLNNKSEKYNETSKKLIIYMIIGTVLFLLLSIFMSKFIDTTYMKDNWILNDLNGINIVIGIIAIPTCFYIIICIAIMSFLF